MTQIARPCVFPTTTLQLAGTMEEVVVGGRDKFHLLPEAFQGVKQIAVIGWGSQGPAQAQNLRDSLVGTGIKVVVGLRPESTSFAKAQAAGFSTDDETLGEMFSVIPQSDFVLLLVADAAQTQIHVAVQAAMKAGSTLGLSHGFLIGYMQNVGAAFRPDINVVGVCPKGMGPSVRRLYEQGKSINGAGINASYAVEQDATGDAQNIALGWAVAIGSPYVFPTTLTAEYCSDLFGERGVLLGGVWGILEALFMDFARRRIIEHDGDPEGAAFCRSALSLTGPISQCISREGLMGILPFVNTGGSFWDIFYATYHAAYPLLEEIYDEVTSGREIASVVDATIRLRQYPMSRVEGSYMWAIGQRVRDTASYPDVIIDATTAGAYVGLMMAQVDLLRANGHGWSEIANETVIEATDSLTPFMHVRGVAHMVDNCSTTARLGTRKWGPRFTQMMNGDVFPNARLLRIPSPSMLDGFKDSFLKHPIHEVLAECMRLRPPVSIAVE